MNIMVTGATGYIGSFLLPRLIDEYDIVYSIGRDKIEKITESGIVECVKYTMDSLPEIVNKLSPELFCNLSAGYYTENSMYDLNVIDGNLKLQFIILEYFKARQEGRFINIGSYWEFSFSNKGVKGVNPYGIIKSTVRNLLEYYAEYNVSYTNIMLYGSYGENDQRGKVIDHIIDSVNSNKVLSLSPGEQKLNFVYVTDIVKSLMTVILCNDKKFKNKTVSIHSSTEYTIREIVCFINEIKQTKLALGASSYRDDEVMSPEYKYENIFEGEDNLKEYIRRRIIEGESLNK